jgi:uncharacterized protein
MTPASGLAIAAAGLIGGAANTFAGGGSLLTFPVLLALGYPPVTANITNAGGLLPGSATGAWAYRNRLPADGGVPALAAAALTRGVIGAGLLVVLPDGAFAVAVPWLIGFACVLVLGQPVLRRAPPQAPPAEVSVWAAALHRHRAYDPACLASPQFHHRDMPPGCPHFTAQPPRPGRPVVAWLGVFAAGLYGGFFGAGQGIVCVGVLSMVRPWGMQPVNAAKNLLCTLVLAAAVALFAATGHMSWPAMALLGAGSAAGGPLGAWLGKRLPAPMLRMVVAALGVVAITQVA